MIIAIDFDETICLMLKEIAKLKNQSWDYNNCKSYTYPRKLWGDNVFDEYLLKAHESPNLEEIPNAIRNIKILQEKHEVFILTCNDELNIVPIKSWLQNKNLTIDVVSAKNIQHKMQMKWNVLIDDHPKLDKYARKNRRIAIQFPQPYNNAYQFLTWDYIPLMINEIEKLLPSIKA